MPLVLDLIDELFSKESLKIEEINDYCEIIFDILHNVKIQYIIYYLLFFKKVSVLSKKRRII